MPNVFRLQSRQQEQQSLLLINCESIECRFVRSCIPESSQLAAQRIAQIITQPGPDQLLSVCDLNRFRVHFQSKIDSLQSDSGTAVQPRGRDCCRQLPRWRLPAYRQSAECEPAAMRLRVN